MWQQYDAATSVKVPKRDPDGPPALQQPSSAMTNGFIPQQYVATAYVPSTTVAGHLSTIDYSNVVTAIPGMNTALTSGIQPAAAAPGSATDPQTSSAAYTSPIGKFNHTFMIIFICGVISFSVLYITSIEQLQSAFDIKFGYYVRI